MKRVWFAFLFCALAYPLIVLSAGKVGATAGSVIVGAFTAIACLIGIPMLSWYRRRGWFSWWHFALGGFLIGLIVSLPFLGSGSFTYYLSIAPIFGALGAGHAFLFWGLAIFKNDKFRSPSERA